MDTGLVIAAALGADWLFGEVRHGHPLAGFGRVAGRLERAWNRRGLSPVVRRLLGALAVVLLVAPCAVAVAYLSWRAPRGFLVDIVVLYFAVGLASLTQHARRVQRALEAADTDAARAAVSMMVSRDTSSLDAPGTAAAAIESVLENGADAVFASLFWYAVGGAPAVVLHRLVNTLDAMWGYRTARLDAFGWAAARLDDLLNWVPATLTVATYALVSGHPLRTLACARRQGWRTASPNAGRAMAAGAGAVGVRVGGPGVYHGRLRWRPRFGVGARPTAAAIGRSLRLVHSGALAWTAIALITGFALA